MFARRALGQSLAREFGPRGVHVAHAVVDGVIDVPRTRAYRDVNGGVEDGKLSAEAVRFVFLFLLFLSSFSLSLPPPSSVLRYGTMDIGSLVVIHRSRRLPRVTGTSTRNTARPLHRSWTCARTSRNSEAVLSR